MIKESEEKHVLERKLHPDGTETIIFKSNTSPNTKIKIAKRFQKKGKSVTLYSDNRLEIRNKLERM